MTSLALALTGLDASNPTPGTYLEVKFAQGNAGGNLGPRRVLIVAPKATASGTITVDTQVVQIQDEADAVLYAGTGSPAHRMARAWFASNKSAEVWLLCPTEGSGSAAVDKITFTTTADANGVCEITLCGETISFPILDGYTVTNSAEAAVAAINNQTHWPVIASNSSGVVTITGKTSGVILNSVRYRARIVGTGVATTVAPTADTALGASGAGGAAIGVGVISMTAALATMLPRKFDVILQAEQSAAAIVATMDQVVVQAEPSTGFLQKVYVGTALTPADAATLASGSNGNRERLDLINAEQCPVEHYVLNAIVAANYVKNNGPNPSYSFDGYGTKAGQSLPGLARPYNDAALPTSTEIRSMLNQGVTPVAYTDGGAPYIVRAVTTRCKTGSAFDYRVRDSHIVTVADRFAGDLAVRVNAAPWTKVAADPVGSAKEPGPDFCTPRRMAALIETLVGDYMDAGHLDPSKRADLIAGIAIGQDPLVPSRLNSRIPLYTAVLLHQHAMMVAESSAAT